MSKTDLNVKVEGNVAAIEIREGKTLEIMAPEKVNILGVLETPLKWLEKRIFTIDQLEAHIIVDRDKKTIELITEETDHYKKHLKGSLQFHPAFLKFGINQGTYKTPLEMAELIKMNRSHFENTSEAMDLVSILRNFKAKINKDVEASLDPNKGDKRVLFAQTVDSNLPPSFKLELPIFKGYPKQVIEVETYFNTEDLTCTLVSPSANDSIESLKDGAIDDVLTQIKAIAPDITIIEI